MKINDVQMDEKQSYSIDEDLYHEYKEPRILTKRKKKKSWKPFFDPR